MQVCCLKPAVGVGSAIELNFEPPSGAAVLAGWSVDTLKVTAAPGDHKPMLLSLTVPTTPPAASAAAFGAAEFAVMVLEGESNGGLRVRITARAWVKPEMGTPPPIPAGKGKK